MIKGLKSIEFDFPPVEWATPEGIVAVGGDLNPERLVAAYAKGIFPWFNDQQPVLWWSPDPRLVLYPREFHLSRSMRRTLRRGSFQCSYDTCFDEIVANCAAPRSSQDSDGTWITADMRQAYGELHRQGLAHSVEVWMDDQLAGGLYGVALGRVFFGESMFSARRDASKVALCYLVNKLAEWRYPIIDCQVRSDHLVSLGAREIPRREFLSIISTAIHRNKLICGWPYQSLREVCLP